MDWGQVWDTFRSGIFYGFLVGIGIVILFFLYYGFVGSTGKARIERAKIRARQIVEAGELPDERTFNYVYYMLSRVPNDPEARGLRAELDKIRDKRKTESAS